MRQDFVANVSHELKTPLASIKAYTETLLDWALHDETVNVRFLKRIEEQAERLNQLILDLLSLARLESGQEVFEHQPLASSRCSSRASSRTAAAPTTKNLDLDLRPRRRSTTRRLVLADEEAIRQIVDNLIDNAIKYTPEGGSVRVGCRLDGDDRSPSRSPTPASASPATTCPASSSGSTASTRRGAASSAAPGLGLSIVKHLVQSIGGQIAVTSRVGSGTKFTVLFPRAAGPPARTDGRSPPK